MSHILFIVTEKNSANGICALSIAKEMVKRGDVVCCIVNREYGDKNTFYCDGIRFETVKPRIVYSINSYLSHRKELSSILRHILSFISFLINKIQLFVSLPTWPVISFSYSKRILSCIRYIYSQEYYELIIPVYTQIDTIIAANRYKIESKFQVKVVPYFLDSLAAGYGPKIMSKKWVENRGRQWENKLLKVADHIIMMKSSQPFYDIIKKDIYYFPKISFLDLPLFSPQKSRLAPIANKGTIEILYIGSIPGHIRNPKYFLDTFCGINNPSLMLTIIGPSTCEELINVYVRKDKRIKRIQSVPHSEALSRILSADILLNLGNNITTMTPSKIFEYISTGKPIISTVPIIEEPCIPYLNKYGNCCLLYENKPLNESVGLVTSFIKEAQCVNPEDLRDIFYLNQPKAFLEVIDTIL